MPKKGLGLGLGLNGPGAEGEGLAPLAGEAHQEVDGTCGGLHTAVAPLKAEHSSESFKRIRRIHTQRREAPKKRSESELASCSGVSRSEQPSVHPGGLC